MAVRFGGRAVAGRVAGVAVTDTAGIVSPAATGKGCGGMTGGTIQAGRYMGRYSIHHACRRISIVAGSTIVDDAGMIEGCRYEATGIMTDPTVLVSVDMIGFLGCGETSVMTGGAVIHDAGVIEGSRQEARGYVTIAAVTVGRHMEVAFSGGSNTIMTACTVIHDALVLEPGVGKGSRGMAHRAILGGWNVVGVDLRILAGGGNSIMAGRAVIHDTGMIEHRWFEAAAGHVADPAILGGCNVGRIDLRSFAGSGNTVMAGIAAHSQNRRVGVVDIECGIEIVGVVATAAIGRGCRVLRSGRLGPGPNGSNCCEVPVVAGDTIAGDTLVS